MGFGCRFCSANNLIYVKTDNEKKAAPLVTGQILISSSIAAFSGATAHLKLEDTSQADAAARLIVELIIKDISHRENFEDKDTTVPFALSAPENFQINPKSDYSVRVWIDLNGNGEKSKGDLFSDQSYRVLTHGFGREVAVRLDT
jgi:uncharacterized lipoprotein YbaY